MPTKKELQQMKKLVKERLGFDISEKSEIDSIPDEDIENIYKDLVQNLEQIEQQPDPQTQGGSVGVENQLNSDPFTQYRQLLQQAHSMASDMTERLGGDFTPFVESSRNGLYYGAAHTSDTSKTKFSEINFPNELTDQLDLSTNKDNTGEVYKWALAEYKKILADARAFTSSNERHRLKELPDRIVVHDKTINATYAVYEIPEKIRRILRG